MANNVVEEFVSAVNNNMIDDVELYRSLGELSMQAANKIQQMLYVAGVDSEYASTESYQYQDRETD